MSQTPASYRCRRDASLLALLECDRAEANRRLNDAASVFLQTQQVLPGYTPQCNDNKVPIGLGPLKDFFRSLQAQWIIDNADIPFPVREDAIEIARGARADSYYDLLEKMWRLVLGTCSTWGESALPMSVGCAIGIVTDMAVKAYALGTIRNVKTTIRFSHYFSGLAVPTEDERFEVFYDCVARRLGNATPNAKAALMLDELRRIGDLIYKGSSTREIQAWAILTLVFFSVFRRKNATEIVNKNVKPLGDGFTIYLLKSKTDQYRHGHEVFIDPLPELPELCPVRAISRWKALLENDEGPFFRHLGPLGMITLEPLHDTTITDLVKRMVAQIGLDPARYSAQSLRAGLITEAIMAGVPLPALAGHTNHKELVSLARYFRPKAENRMLIVRTLATAPHHEFAARLTEGKHAPSVLTAAL